MPQILIDISPTGDIKIDAQGFQGTSCAKATEQIELVLGGQEVKKDPKPEYYVPAGNSNTTKLTF